ncbi:SusC/RagA family TonB-linked outer membrane protein [Tamlana flava]|uniref:SusC/RagA family TonB-linked outer membrane protein n=1 Tax=Tamlana flava TaxID=3158572 RepID=UPI00351B1CD9
MTKRLILYWFLKPNVRETNKSYLKKYHFVLLYFVFALCSTYMMAQNKTVNGVVTDGTLGGGLPGVSVLVKGTAKGAATDFDGNYTLTDVSPNATLVFSYLGYITQEVPVSNQSTINVTMEEDITSLDEIVIVDYGYGKVRKDDMTGSTASISSKELAKIPVANAAEALSGRLPGVNVTTADGEPGADIRIRVRGGGSITQDNSPLYVVDGFIVDNINDIPPNDIASIDVLKDASATAVYGAQASNGVIVVTTKSPVEGKIAVSYNNFLKFNTLPEERKYDVLSPYEFALANYEHSILQSEARLRSFEKFFGVYEDLELYRQKPATDWQDELFGKTRLSQYHNVTVGGGSEMTKINLSVSHNDEQGLLDNSGYKRTAINFKLNQKISDRLTFDASTRITSTERAGTGVNVKSAVQTRPTNGIADELDIDFTQVDGDNDFQQFIESLTTPVEQITRQNWRRRQYNQYVLNTSLAWAITDELTAKSTYTSQKDFYEERRFWGPLTGESFNNGGSMPLGQRTITESQNYRWVNTLNYKKEWTDSKLDLLIGHEASSDGGKSNFARFEDFRLSITPEELFANTAFGRLDRISSSEFTDSNRLSFFTRADFQLQNKYVWTLTARADQSSRFKKENRLGIFPALAFAWKIEEEDFMEGVGFVDKLKLRISYGETGNDRIDPTSTQFLFEGTTNRGPGFGNVFNVYYTPSSSSLYNPDLKWETTTTNNLGLDFLLFNKRLNGNLDYYKNETRDLLLQSAIPNNTGFNTQWGNIGTTSNEGVELGLTAYLIENKDFSLSINGNIGVNKFTIDRLDGTNERFEISNWASTDLKEITDYYLRVGGPIGDIYGYVTDGFYSTDDFRNDDGTQRYDPATGKYTPRDDVPDSGPVVGNANIRPGFLKLKDLNGDGIIDGNDRKVIGNTLPDFQGGFGFNARYKGFDLSAFFNFQKGNDVYNTGKIQYNQFRRITYGNLLNTMNSANRFTYIDPEGQYTGTPGAVVTDLNDLDELNQDKTIWSHASHGVAQAVIHSWAVEDGSFLRLNNVTLGYNFPQSWISKLGMSQCRLYATGSNLFIWTKYSGYDPEVNSSSNPLTPGIDNSSFPRSRSYTVGLNVTF